MQTDNMNIAGKFVVITGASSGLGEATARHLAERGAPVVLGARRAERLQALVDQITRAGGNATGIVTDLTDAAPPHMQRQKSGHIINVSSVAGHRVGPGSAVYAATKTAVRMISEGLRQEVKPWNLRTTIISPGAVATELPNSITDADVAKGIGQFYEQYAISADSFGRAVAFAIGQPEDVDINEIPSGRRDGSFDSDGTALTTGRLPERPPFGLPHRGDVRAIEVIGGQP
jgi:NADP-dependent 3-hydroxy acid dehydrogenase YdfG